MKTLLNPYWTLVAVCLEEFFSQQKSTAEELAAAAARRAKSSETDSPLDYHAEPVHIAEDIMRARVKWTSEKRKHYVSLRDQVYRRGSVKVVRGMHAQQESTGRVKPAVLRVAVQ